MTDRQLIQLLLDALRALLSGGPDGQEQARVKVDKAQAALVEDEAGVSE